MSGRPPMDDDSDDEYDAWGFEKRSAAKNPLTVQKSTSLNSSVVPSFTTEPGSMFGGKSLLVNAGIGRGRGRGLAMMLQNRPNDKNVNSLDSRLIKEDRNVSKTKSRKTDSLTGDVNSAQILEEQNHKTVTNEVLAKPAYGNFDDADCFYDEFDDDDDDEGFYIGGMSAKDFVGSRTPKEPTLNKQGIRKAAPAQHSQPSEISTEPDTMLAELAAAHPDIPRATLERMVAVHRDKSRGNNRESEEGKHRQCLEVSFMWTD